MIKYLFFDFDGTISDARTLVYSAMSDTIEGFGYKFSRVKLRKLMGLKTKEILRELGIKGGDVRKVRSAFFKKAIKRMNSKSLKLCSSVKPLYDLKEGGIKLIVVSNGKNSFMEAAIRVLKIGGLFNELYGSSLFRTKDRMLKKLFKKYKIKPKETLYIGDRFSDIDYAHRAHCHAVAIHNKCAWSTKKEILAEKPDFIISDFKDLKELVEKLNS